MGLLGGHCDCFSKVDVGLRGHGRTYAARGTKMMVEEIFILAVGEGVGFLCLELYL